jgi:hypothetical protein
VRWQGVFVWALIGMAAAVASYLAVAEINRNRVDPALPTTPVVMDKTQVPIDVLHPWGLSTKSSGCAYNSRNTDVLPDVACTPGSTNPAVTQYNIQQTICVRGWSSKERAAKYPSSASSQDKIKSLQAYGQPREPSQYEYDHLVPIEVGGNPSDAKANLWPEPLSQAKDKDQLENYLHAEVCAGRMQLRDAQNMIAVDWYASYQQHVSAGRIHSGSPGPSTSEDSGV